MSTFPLSLMKRLLRRTDNKRVSQSAAIELDAVLEDFGQEIAEQAIKLAKERDVKTVSKKDIRKSVKLLTEAEIHW